MPNVTYTTPESNIQYTTEDGTEVVYNLGDMAFSEYQQAPRLGKQRANRPKIVMTAMALVWIMIPGVGFFYSGLLRRKNALSMIFLSIAGISVGTFQWFFWGYSLAFSGKLWVFAISLRR